MKNSVIRELMESLAVRQWKVAERYGLSEGNFSRLLRRELPLSQKKQIIQIIQQLAAEIGGKAE